ncbi:Ig-like domain-containing protein [Psychrobacter urativorans]|uniref:Ig-like domain-containing protein n=1 Tax=Psychrobacter urativorans TaxID=45610 RepID=UPI003618F09B
MDDFATAEIHVSPAHVGSVHDSDSQFSILGLGALTLLSFGSNPVANFSIADGLTGDATITVSNSSLFGVFNSAKAVVQQLNEDTGRYETIDRLGDGGLITLIGIGSGKAEVELPDLDAGHYRVIGGSGGVRVFGTTKVKAEVDLFDPSTPGEVSAASIHGNVIDENDVVTDSTVITDVNGETIIAVSTIEGDYGTLVINPNGAYSYMPNEDINVIGQTDQFEYTIADANGKTDSATLTIDIISEFPAPVVAQTSFYDNLEMANDMASDDLEDTRAIEESSTLNLDMLATFDDSSNSFIMDSMDHHIVLNDLIDIVGNHTQYVDIKTDDHGNTTLAFTGQEVEQTPVPTVHNTNEEAIITGIYHTAPVGTDIASNIADWDNLANIANTPYIG